MATTREECFVFLQLPHSTETVTCGRFELVQPDGSAPVGRFVYGRRYRARPDAVALDPFLLPLTASVKETADERGLFGALRDAGPDAWGRMTIDRALGRSELSEIEYLLHAPQDGAGALTFGRAAEPPPPLRPFNQVMQLEALYEIARAIEDDRGGREMPAPAGIPPQVVQLIEPSTAMGGARPKNVVEDTDGLWLAKFPARDDPWNNAAVEGGLLALAKRCGIRVPVTRRVRLGAQDVLLVQRFDRAPTGNPQVRYFRHRMVSALTVLRASESPVERRNWSYLLLADELGRWSARPRRDRQELFRRMVFNCLVSNTDDHPRNHALIAAQESWELAPAYDLTPTRLIGQTERTLAMEIGTRGRQATRENVCSLAPRFDLTMAEADAIVSEIGAVVAAEWEGCLRFSGATTQDVEAVRPAILNVGFEYRASE